MRATVNQRNNLGYCFHCGKNYNTIDLLQALDYHFSSAVALLERLLQDYQGGVPHGKRARS